MSIQISQAELEVMKILWQLGGATSSEIIEALTKTTTWKPKTIQTLITRLTNKGAIEREKITGRLFKYSPCITNETYVNQANQSFLKKVYNGSVKMLMMSFIKESKLSSEDIVELRKLLDEKEMD